MYEKRIGGLNVSVTGEKITFALAGNREHSVSLDTKFHEELIDFLNAFTVEQKEARVGFRMPLSASLYGQLDSAFEATLSCEGALLSSHPKDISLTGISFDLEEMVALCPSVQSSVDIKLMLGSPILEIPRIVRRRDKRLIGISFENMVDKTDFEPPDELIHMVRSLEREWLKMQRNAF